MKWDTREDLPHLLNDMQLLGPGVCVGVQRAVFESHLRRHWKGGPLIGVDPWKPYEGSPTTAEQHEEYRRTAVAALDAAGGDWTFMRTTSLAAAAELARMRVQLSFVHLDGDHRYDEVKKEIAAWWPLVKSGGVLCGHDWISDGWHRNGDPYTAYKTEQEAAGDVGHCGEFGVRKAVAEFCTGPFPALCVTSPNLDDGWQSWLIVKP